MILTVQSSTKLELDGDAVSLTLPPATGLKMVQVLVQQRRRPEQEQQVSVRRPSNRARKARASKRYTPTYLTGPWALACTTRTSRSRSTSTSRGRGRGRSQRLLGLTASLISFPLVFPSLSQNPNNLKRNLSACLVGRLCLIPSLPAGAFALHPSHSRLPLFLRSLRVLPSSGHSRRPTYILRTTCCNRYICYLVTRRVPNWAALEEPSGSRTLFYPPPHTRRERASSVGTYGNAEPLLSLSLNPRKTFLSSAVSRVWKRRNERACGWVCALKICDAMLLHVTPRQYLMHEARIAGGLKPLNSRRLLLPSRHLTPRVLRCVDKPAMQTPDNEPRTSSPESIPTLTNRGESQETVITSLSCICACTNTTIVSSHSR
jgi:hypothetical protein